MMVGENGKLPIVLLVFVAFLTTLSMRPLYAFAIDEAGNFIYGKGIHSFSAVEDDGGEGDEDEDEGEDEDEDYLKLSINYQGANGDGDYSDRPIYYGDSSVIVSVRRFEGGYDSGSEGRKSRYEKVALKVGGKLIKGSTGASGQKKFKIPIMKVGTKVTAYYYHKYGYDKKTVKIKSSGLKYRFFERYVDSSGNTPYEDGKWDGREKFPNNIMIRPTYSTSSKTTIVVKNIVKGDFLKMRVGKKVYTKKFNKNAKTFMYKLPHPRTDYGSPISVSHYNKYKQKMGVASSVVFSGTKLKKGLKKNQVKYLRLFGSPDSSSNLYGGWWEYDYYNGDSWLPYVTIYFSGGRVRGWTYY